jgi:hypothetical protein
MFHETAGGEAAVAKKKLAERLRNEVQRLDAAE